MAPLCALTASASFALLAVLTYPAEQAAFPPNSRRNPAQGKAEPRLEGATFSIRPLSETAYELSYGFQNFNDDALRLTFPITRKDFEGSLKEFGWRKSEVDAIYARSADAQQAKRQVHAYFSAHGFRVLPGNRLMADVPTLVKRNSGRVNAAALAMAQEGESRDYGSDDLIGAAAAMVQTAVAYRVPPDLDQGVHIGGIYPPPRTLVYGWGDCDTKSALLGALLANWDGVQSVGISLPEHYLMAIARVARNGDAYVEYNGRQYILIESAGPAWLPPGTIDEHTQTLLDNSNGVPIHPF